MVINADCSLGNLSLVPAPASGSSQLSVIPVLEGSDALGLHEHLHSCADAYTLTCTHTHTQLKIIKNIIFTKQ